MTSEGLGPATFPYPQVEVSPFVVSPVVLYFSCLSVYTAVIAWLLSVKNLIFFSQFHFSLRLLLAATVTLMTL